MFSTLNTVCLKCFSFFSLRKFTEGTFFSLASCYTETVDSWRYTSLAPDAVSSECVHALRRWCLVYCVLNPSFHVKTSHDTKQAQNWELGGARWLLLSSIDNTEHHFQRYIQYVSVLCLICMRHNTVVHLYDYNLALKPVNLSEVKK